MPAPTTDPTAATQGISNLLPNANDHGDALVWRIVRDPVLVLVFERKQVAWQRLKRLAFKSEQLPRRSRDLQCVFVMNVSVPATVMVRTALGARRYSGDENATK